MEDDTWQPGTVARVQVEHEGGTAPFAVQLDRGDAVIAPADEEREYSDTTPAAERGRNG